ncbi:MAG: 3'(2'),5'-bisphosphate nucleotidase CysQ [Halioglobus sp.]
MEQYSVLVKPLILLAQRAAEVICGHYHSAESGVFEAKGDDTPLTRADLDSHDILLEGLQSLGLGIPILSEESTSVTTAQRLGWQRYWLVDPLDGTREFLERTGEFTINIALIEQHKPVLGLLYQPLKNRAYIGIPGDKAICYQLEPDGSWSQRELKTRTLNEDQPLLVLASRRHRGPRIGACLNWLEQQWGSIDRHNSGSAMKFCQMVEGQGDFYPRFSPCCEWDTGAGQALLEAAGGCLVGMDGEALRYNCSESLYSPDFYAISDPTADIWRRLLVTELT